MKTNKKTVAAVLVIVAMIMVCMVRLCTPEQSRVVISRAGTWNVPKRCKNIALLGSTPHPTLYLTKYPQVDLSSIVLSDFVDVAALRDSFEKTFELCKKHQIDHLVIAYLPVYYAQIRKEFGNQAPAIIDLFLTRIAPQVRELILDILQTADNPLPVTLFLPTSAELARIPSHTVSDREYAQYLIKQFPRLEWGDSELQTITIINTKFDDGEQSNAIERYLQYEYLFSRPVEYRHAVLEKQKFHTYM